MRYEVQEIFGDAPASILSGDELSIDIETSGLDFRADRIGSIQGFDGGVVWVVRPPFKCRNISDVLADERRTKIFHNAIFDLRFLMRDFGVRAKAIKCTKIAAKVLLEQGAKTSLKDLVLRFFGVELDKSLRLSNWDAKKLRPEQLSYAAADAFFLPELFKLIASESQDLEQISLMEQSFDYLPVRAELDLRGIGDVYKY